MGLRMMGITNSSHLSRVIASVGLVQNLGALRALTSVGIIEGHMKLHIRNLSLGAGATESEIPTLQVRLEQILASTKRISLQNAVQILEEIRHRDQEV
jgi:hydroxymethylglutaryl-CoA reductase